VGCIVNLQDVPIADKKFIKQCLEFGDDYKLLYTVPPSKLQDLQRALKSKGEKCHTIGTMGGKKLKIINNSFGSFKNWDHFQ